MKLGLVGFRRPSHQYRIRHRANRALRQFETLAQVEKERLRRIRAVQRQLRRNPNRAARRALTKLLHALKHRSSRLRGSMANPLCMHRLRKRVAGQLWALLERTRRMDPATCTLVPWRWEIPAGELDGFDPTRALATLRRLINSHGGDRADGYLVAFIHGTFEPRRQVYVLHLHCLVAGGMRRVIDGTLRACSVFAIDHAAYGNTEWIYRRIRFDAGLRRLPAQLTYMIKGYWPQQWQGLISGKARRGRKGRIAEPHHTEVLLWLNRWRLNDIALLMNVSAGRDGFVLAERAYTNKSVR